MPCLTQILKQILLKAYLSLISYDFVLHIPKAFTPNNDGENEYFKPEFPQNGSVKSYYMIIYNQWGGVH